MLENSQLNNGSQHTLSGAWVVTYLALHMIWMQTVFGPYSFLTLRIPFLIVVFTCLLWCTGVKGFWSALEFLRIPSLFVSVTFLLLTLAARYLLGLILPWQGVELSLSYLIVDVIIPPINEELLFRLVFLQILICRLGVQSFRAVFLAALIFAACHSLSSVLDLFYLLLSGIIYGFACIHPKGGVFLAILCHALWNLYPLFIGA